MLIDLDGIRLVGIGVTVHRCMRRIDWIEERGGRVDRNTGEEAAAAIARAVVASVDHGMVR
jgi:hypothetical protein